MNDLGVPVVDFYDILVKRMDLARGDVFHWTGKAYNLIAEAAVVKIVDMLPAKHLGGTNK